MDYVHPHKIHGKHFMEALIKFLMCHDSKTTVIGVPW
ncbi:MAG: hypothetical protein ACJAUZ_003003 [Flavobacteriaceae bacterium]